MEDFVTYELAVKLKEKGFRRPCILYYNSDKVRTWFNEPYIAKNFIPTTLGNDDVLAPTISQVLKWLREEKKIHIVIDFDSTMNWYYQIALYGLTTYEKESKHKYNSYEQAVLAGIEYVLDKLI